jgi:hypothetical protein
MLAPWRMWFERPPPRPPVVPSIASFVGHSIRFAVGVLTLAKGTRLQLVACVLSCLDLS